MHHNIISSTVSFLSTYCLLPSLLHFIHRLPLSSFPSCLVHTIHGHSFPSLQFSLPICIYSLLLSFHPPSFFHHTHSISLFSLPSSLCCIHRLLFMVSFSSFSFTSSTTFYHSSLDSQHNSRVIQPPIAVHTVINTVYVRANVLFTITCSTTFESVTQLLSHSE